jgi:hypothetical protein
VNVQNSKQKCLWMKETITMDMRICQVKIIVKNKKNLTNLISH